MLNLLATKLMEMATRIDDIYLLVGGDDGQAES